MTTKRSGTVSMESTPSKRTKKESKAEVENQIARILEKAENVQALLSKSLAAEASDNPEFRNLEMWTLAVRLEFDDFELGSRISEPPPVSHPQYGLCSHPSPLQLT